jgi:D-glycero-alpha-D-manno-heptose 1-phosphate guanylyltransferase
MKAVVLCGGLGTRLGELTRNTPKPMLHVAGRPFIAHVLDHICTAGVDEIVLAAGFAWQPLHSFVGNQWAGRAVRYSVEEHPLGTGGAVLKAMRVAQIDQALVLNGDTLFRLDIDAFLTKAPHDVATTIALRTVADCSRFGRVELDADERINSFGEKGHAGAGLINAGIYLQHRCALETFGDSPFSFESDYLAARFATAPIAGLVFDDYFIDIGVPADLERAQRELALVGPR